MKFVIRTANESAQYLGHLIPFDSTLSDTAICNFRPTGGWYQPERGGGFGNLWTVDCAKCCARLQRLLSNAPQ